MKEITPEKVQNDVYILLKTIFHYERIEIGKYGFDFAQLYTLEFLLRNSNMRVTDLSRELQLPMFTVSRLVNRMEKKGFLTKQQDSADRRNYYLTISQKGQDLIKDLRNASFKRISGNLATLDESEIKHIMSLADYLHIVLGVTKEVFPK